MPDAARIAQAQALEIPVTVQGAKSADETGRRELFTECAKTTLTFDNGAVLNLRTRVTPGQSVFLRNDQTGQEILCKVLEAPRQDESGYTDLEFMEIAPGFWEGDPEETQAAEEMPEAAAEKSGTQTATEQPEPAAAKSEAEITLQNSEAVAEEADSAAESEPGTEMKHAAAIEPSAAPMPEPEKPAASAHEQTEAAAENSLAMMSATASEVKLPSAQAPEEEEKPKGRLREELVPAHEMVPEPPPAPAATEPSGEQIDAAGPGMASEPVHAHDDAADPNNATDEANLAALMAREAKLAKFAALKEKVAAQLSRGPAARDAFKDAKGTQGAKDAQGAQGAEPVQAAEKTEGADGAGEAIAEEAGPPKAPLADRLTTGKNLIYSEIVVGVAIVVAFGFIWRAVRPLFIHPGELPVAAAALPRKATAPLKAPLPVVVPAPAPAAAIAKVRAASPVVVASAPVAKIVRPAAASKESATASEPHVVEPEPAAEQPKPVEPIVPKPPENIPAKIIAGSQPPFPPWAKKLDVSGVVKLDAVIAENGNLGRMRLVSGPRLLRRAAEQAVQLWIFEPAQIDGKPAASHMVLTVEFKR